MANAYDFTIDTLDFRCATSRQTPYVRSTAPFRKDQVDTSQAAGDQSLTGWWTRGQFSFHKGSSVKYYDSSEDVLYRSAWTDRVIPWVAGQVSITRTRNLLDTPSLSGVSDYTWLALSNRKLVSVGGSPGKLYVGTTQVTTLSVPTDPVQAVVAHGSYVWVATANRIEHGQVNSDGTYTAGAVICTNSNAGSSGDNIMGVWYAKDRLWFIDSDNNWYSVPADTQTTIPTGGGSYLFWKMGRQPTNPGIVETPGPVLMNDNRYIYSITLASDGSVPTITAPTVVADLGTASPASNTGIQAIAYTRGWVGVLTERAFVAGEMDNSGALVLGPELIHFYNDQPTQVSQGKSVIAVSDRFYFAAAGIDSSHVDLYEVNTADATGTLQPTWTQFYRSFLTSGSNVHLVTDGTTGSEFAAIGWPSSAYRFILDQGATVGTASTLDANTTGTVQTGYHRFGTLDDKQFYSITVTAFCQRTGYVDVYYTDAAGTKVHVGTAGNGKTELSLAASAPMEKMSFQFVLNANSAVPKVTDCILLGYQVKALPVPQRQRILKVPLVVADRVETRWKRDTGKAGRAWSDLQKLEALESSKAIVPFTDHRTGETGSAYIDSIDFQGEVPTDGASSNFGGVAYATLRVVGA